MFASGSLRDRAYNAFHHGYLYILVGSVLIGIAIYLAVSFFALMIERKMVIGFVNTLRRSWYIIMFGSSEQTLTNERKADFIAKATYHFPLISLGIDNSALGIVRWSLSACVLFAVGSMGGNNIFMMSLGIVIVSVIVGLIAYFIANHYVTREVASYSQVIKNISNNLSEFSLFKTFRREFDAMKELDARVDIDTHFRIRRDLWLRYFNKVIYTFIFISSFCLIIIGLYYPETFSRFYTNENLFLISLLSIYSLRLLYESGRTGLYLPPLRLGLVLSIPENISSDLLDKKVMDWTTLEFRSNKTKLHSEGSYFKRLSIRLDIGKRYLFIGEPYIGKTSLAEILAGKARYNRNSWLVKLDNNRFEYRNWFKMNIGSYYISSYFTSEKTVGEIIFAKDKQYIFSEDLLLVYKMVEKHKFFEKLISKKRFVGESLRSFEINKSLLFAIYTLHCLISKPSIIIVDNYWTDLDYAEINELLRLIDTELPKSTVVYFSRTNNDIISYNNKYEIKKENIISL
jgi:energy-coupling factor transporter ATP-binding protein EcfA2